MPEAPAEIVAQLVKLSARLDKRAQACAVLGRYYEGGSPIPAAIVRASVTKAYRMLMPLAEAPWGSLVVDSTQDRLEVAGIRSGDDAVDKAVWGIWQDNQMDAESKIGHNASLIDGRSFAMVWRSDGDDFPQISLDDSSTAIVQYKEGSRRERVAGLRRWTGDDDRPNANLYRPDGIFKFVGPDGMSGQAGTQWEPRIVPGEEWPIPNPWDVVPMIELPVNRRLRRGTFGHARGEYEHCTGLIDRINLLTFLGLVVAFWMGFPLRGTIGEKIMRDDKGVPIAPFDSNASGVVQLENPEAKTFEFPAADRKNLSVFAELDQLAMVTKTPRHYFPIEGGMSNLSADAIRASEGALHAKVTDYKATLGEGWEEVLRVAGLMAAEPVALSPRASLMWKDHESRSLAERADAATKLKDLLPWQVIAEVVMNATQDDVDRWNALRGSEVFNQLLGAAGAPVTVPPAPPVPAGANGAG